LRNISEEAGLEPGEEILNFAALPSSRRRLENNPKRENLKAGPPAILRHPAEEV